MRARMPKDLALINTTLHLAMMASVPLLGVYVHVLSWWGLPQ